MKEKPENNDPDRDKQPERCLLAAVPSKGRRWKKLKGVCLTVVKLLA